MDNAETIHKPRMCSRLAGSEDRRSGRLHGLRDKKASKRPSFTDEEALQFHQGGKPGKLEINPTKPMATQRDLSLAYSPGVAVPVRRIAEEPDTAYDYTAKGNLVAVISNGTAILGLGDLGALASKPVMEGKAVLFKRFADVDSIDLEVDTSDVDAFINAVRYLGPSFGGINLEDIKAPDCFIIEQRLRELMDIPVFHDDQHGTAIIATAGLINALEITGRDIRDDETRMQRRRRGGDRQHRAHQGHGSAARQRHSLRFQRRRLPGPHRRHEPVEIRACGRHQGAQPGRGHGGADVFFGLSVKGALTPAMVKSMAAKPIIFAMANPDPEITPEEVQAVRDDAIMATGRSDYPNQINNVLGFPYIFRGALDVRATTINEAMKIAAAQALAQLAREDVPDEVAAAYYGSRLRFGPEYLIPVPFDPRLISTIPVAVAKAAMDSGVARHAIADLDDYAARLSARLDPIAGSLQGIFEQVRMSPRRIVFTEGEEERMIRAANIFAASGLGEAILIGRETEIEAALAAGGLELNDGVTVFNARLSGRNAEYASFLYERLQRTGFLSRDCQRLVNNDRNVFAACMVALGDADGLVTGVTRNFSVALDNVRRAIDQRPGTAQWACRWRSVAGRTVFIADTSVIELPEPGELADIAEEAANVCRRFGYEPRVALLVLFDLRVSARRPGRTRARSRERARPAQSEFRI